MIFSSWTIVTVHLWMVSVFTTAFVNHLPQVTSTIRLSRTFFCSNTIRSLTTTTTTKTSSSSSNAMLNSLPPPLIDVDCNLLHEDLKSIIKKNDDDENSPPQVGDILLEDATKETNIRAMLTPASTLEETKLSLDFLENKHNHENIQLLTTAGIHPYNVEDTATDKIESYVEELKTLIQLNRKYVAAVGECGLDASEGFPSLEKQLPWFEVQVKLAKELNLPLFIHERLAFQRTMDILSEIEEQPIIIHCFTGTREECQQYVDRGYYISISGFIAKQPVGDEIRACLEEGIIPLNRLMIETDAPYMGFPNCRSAWLEKQSDYVSSLNGKKRKRLQNGQYPNVPSSLLQVLDHVVAALNTGRTNRNMEILTREEVATATVQNAIDFFGFHKDKI